MRFLKLGSHLVSAASGIVVAVGHYVDSNSARLCGAIAVIAASSTSFLLEWVEQPSRRRHVGAVLAEYFRDQVLAVPPERRTEIPSGFAPYRITIFCEGRRLLGSKMKTVLIPRQRTFHGSDQIRKPKTKVAFLPGEPLVGAVSQKAPGIGQIATFKSLCDCNGNHREWQQAWYAQVPARVVDTMGVLDKRGESFIEQTRSIACMKFACGKSTDDYLVVAIDSVFADGFADEFISVQVDGVDDANEGCGSGVKFFGAVKIAEMLAKASSGAVAR